MCLINVVMVMASVERCLHVVCDMILSSVPTVCMPKSQVFQWSECVLLLLGMKPSFSRPRFVLVFSCAIQSSV